MATAEWQIINPPDFAVTFGVTFEGVNNQIISGPVVGPINQTLSLNIENGLGGHFIVGVFGPAAAVPFQQEFKRIPGTGELVVEGDTLSTVDFGGGAAGGFGGIGALLLIVAVAFAFTGRKKSRR